MRYFIVRAYDDCVCGSEHVETISNALSAAAIYLEDTSCVSLTIIDAETGKVILSYGRD